MLSDITIWLRPWRVAALIAAIKAGFAAFTLAGFLLLGVDGARHYASFRRFDIAIEGNVANYAAALVLLMAALCCFLNAGMSAGRDERRWPGWRALGLVFAFLSIDEAAAIHEQFSRIKAGFTGDLAFIDHYSWVLVYTPAALVLGLAFLPFLLDLPRRTAALIVLAGALYLFGAVGLEAVGGWQQTAGGMAPTALAVGLRSIAEESVESLVIAMFIGAALAHAARHRATLSLQVGEPWPQRRPASRTPDFRSRAAPPPRDPEDGDAQPALGTRAPPVYIRRER